jgi:hypothetical protein
MMENIYTIKCQKKISVTIFILDKVPQNEEWYHEGYFIAIKKLIHQGHIINSVYTPAMYWIVTPPTKSSYVEIMYPFVWQYWSGPLKKWSGLSEVMSVEPCSVRPVICFSFFVFFSGGSVMGMEPRARQALYHWTTFPVPRTGTHIKEEETWHLSFFAVWRHSKKAAIYQLEDSPQQKLTKLALCSWTFQPPDLWQHMFMVFK